VAPYGQHQAPALDRHAVRHHQDQLVALDRGHHRQADAGVARSRLDDRAAGLELAVALGVLDHRQGDPVLDRSARVAAFGLDPDGVLVAEQAVDADVRRAADGLEDVGGFHWRVSCGKKEGILAQPTPFPARLGRNRDNWAVKPARPPLVQGPRGRTGGTSGLHRAA